MSEDVDRLFVALRVEPPPLREQRLRELCNDAHVRQQVLELLGADQAASEQHWLEAPPVALASAWIGCEETETDAADSSQPAQVGRTIRPPMPSRIGRYEVRGYLGGGGFADVYRAYDPHLDIDVAVKVSRRSVDGERECERFLREAQHVIKLNHPHIVRVYNADVTGDGQAFIVMEYIAGTTLREYADGRPRLTLEEVSRILQPVCDAMACAHQANLVHRDLKPGNILISQDGVAKVTDFGLAVRDDSPHVRGEYAGTTAYMAPEQIRGESNDLHGSTDVWALGVMLYELLTGRRPFQGSREQIHDEILTRTPKRLREVRDDIPVEVEAICTRCLAKDPAGRPGSARDVARVLQDASVPDPHAGRTHGSSGKRVGLVAAVVGSVSIAAVLVTIFRRDGDRAVFPTMPAARPAWLDPKTIVFTPYDDYVDSHGYDPARGIYHFDTHDVSLFQAGVCSGEELKLKVRFRIEDSERVGQAGVFWAWGAVMGDERIDSCCWAIQLGRVQPGAPFVVEVKQYHVGPSDGRHRVLDKNPVGLPIEIAEPQERSFEIEARVTASRVTQIIVNGESVLDSPLPLEALLGRDWRQLQGSAYGFCGYHGTFSIETFSTD